MTVKEFIEQHVPTAHKALQLVEQKGYEVVFDDIRVGEEKLKFHSTREDAEKAGYAEVSSAIIDTKVAFLKEYGGRISRTAIWDAINHLQEDAFANSLQFTVSDGSGYAIAPFIHTDLVIEYIPTETDRLHVITLYSPRVLVDEHNDMAANDVEFAGEILDKLRLLYQNEYNVADEYLIGNKLDSIKDKPIEEVTYTRLHLAIELAEHYFLFGGGTSRYAAYEYLIYNPNIMTLFSECNNSDYSLFGQYRFMFIDKRFTGVTAPHVELYKHIFAESAKDVDVDDAEVDAYSDSYTLNEIVNFMLSDEPYKQIEVTLEIPYEFYNKDEDESALVKQPMVLISADASDAEINEVISLVKKEYDENALKNAQVEEDEEEEEEEWSE